jgi:predicted nucleic acid-binding protein
LESYLLDTSTLSALLDPKHAKHASAKAAIQNIEAAQKFVSVIAIGELVFGQNLIRTFTGTIPPGLNTAIRAAIDQGPLGITHHTASEYGELKARLAKVYLKKALSRQRPRWLENWIDHATGQRLQVDENDLWMCAQARERNLIFITADAKMIRVSDADPAVRLLIV